MLFIMSKTEEQGKTEKEKTFGEFGKKVDQFVDELDEAAEKLKVEFTDKFEELKQSVEKFKKETKNKDRWKEVESSLKNAVHEFEHAFKAAFGNDKKKGQ